MTNQAQQKAACDMKQLREEQLFARQKLKEVETSVATSSNSIIQEMGQMLINMANLEQSVATKFAAMSSDSEKRQSVTEAEKADPFTTKTWLFGQGAVLLSGPLCFPLDVFNAKL